MTPFHQGQVPPGPAATRHTLPFGKHKGQPLPEVPVGYLTWAVGNVKLSSGLRAAVRTELLARGVHPSRLPREPEPKPVSCRHCGGADLRLYWQEIHGGRTIRGDCSACGRFAGYLPQTPQNVALADATGSPRGLLDVLLQAEQEKVAVVHRPSGWLDLAPPGRASADLAAKVRMNAHLLRSLLPCVRSGRGGGC